VISSSGEVEFAMSIESITEKIVSEANAFAADAISHAETEAKSIVQEYDSIANKEFDQIVDAAYEKSREIMNRADAQSMKEKRVSILSVKWEYLDNAFSAAIDMLGQMSEDEQVHLMSRLVMQYQCCDAELIFNKKDRERIGEKVVGAVKAGNAGNTGNAASAGNADDTEKAVSDAFNVTLSERTGEFSGGLILKEGGIETNLTYEALVASRREQLEDEVIPILFG